MLDRLYGKHVLLLAPARQEFDHALSRRSFFFRRQVDHHSVSANDPFDNPIHKDLPKAVLTDVQELLFLVLLSLEEASMDRVADVCTAGREPRRNPYPISGKKGGSLAPSGLARRLDAAQIEKRKVPPRGALCEVMPETRDALFMLAAGAGFFLASTSGSR
jgi:hypothetical protein